MKNKSLKNKLAYIIPIYFLLVISLLNMYGASFISDLYSSNFIRQLIWILIGTVAMFIVYKIDIKIFLKHSKFFYIAGNILLVLILFFGRAINGAKSWFKIGPISFQPSELFKFFYLLFIAQMISKEKKGSKFTLLKIIVFTFIPCILIFLEPDTGVVLMYLLLMFGLTMESGIKKRSIGLICAFSLLLISAFLGLYFLKEDLFIELFGTSFFYRMDRLLNFTNDNSYQLNQALIGIGASGTRGFGLMHEKIYIPEAVTDFVFALSICNFGYIMGIILVATYTYILYRLYREIGESKKTLDKCILSGIFYMMLFQVAEHILMNLGLTPITGITLPFLSYGGSSLLSYFMMFGLILKITTNNSSYN